jgi:hypothetical protein
MLVGVILKGKSLKGYLEKGLIEPQSIEKRHEEIVREIQSRGYNHKSPLCKIGEHIPTGFVPRDDSGLELFGRCEECRRRILEKINKMLAEGKVFTVKKVECI